MTSAEQVAHYQTFGFLSLRGAFNPDEVAAIGAVFDQLLARERGGKPFAGESRQTFFGIAEQDPLLSQMVEGGRIYQTVEQ